MTEQELIRRANEGDQRAKGELICMHQLGLRNYIEAHWRNKREFHDWMDGEDIFAEVCVRFVQCGYLIPELSVIALLITMADRCIIQQTRRCLTKKRDLNRTLRRQQDVEGRLLNVIDCVKSESETPSRIVCSAECGALVRQAIRELAHEIQQRIVHLKFFDGFSDKEVCLELDISYGAMRGHKHRA
ncbi:MAG: sigma-70 family RNA polymerase sigma factor, partial [Pirellulaceae bacterium]|nr:sigma-70 family RNA polymerase sigma factor [Pirellulaceae bacterium]